MIISAHKSVHLNCSIRHSSPPPTLTWWYKAYPKDATAYKPSLDGWKRLKTDNTSSLEQLLIPASRDHVFYKCIAENWLGQDSITYTILRRLGRYKWKIFYSGKQTWNASKFQCRVRIMYYISIREKQRGITRITDSTPVKCRLKAVGLYNSARGFRLNS